MNSGLTEIAEEIRTKFRYVRPEKGWEIKYEAGFEGMSIDKGRMAQ